MERRWVGNCSSAKSGQRREGTGRRKAMRLQARNQTLKSEPWTWQWGEINPQSQPRRKPSRTWETSRTARHWADGSVHCTDAGGECRDEGPLTPRKALRAVCLFKRGHRNEAGRRAKYSEEERSVREDEPGLRKRAGGRWWKKRTRSRRQKWRASAGAGNPIGPLLLSHTTLWNAANLTRVTRWVVTPD